MQYLVKLSFSSNLMMIYDKTQHLGTWINDSPSSELTQLSLRSPLIDVFYRTNVQRVPDLVSKLVSSITDSLTVQSLLMHRTRFSGASWMNSFQRSVLICRLVCWRPSGSPGASETTVSECTTPTSTSSPSSPAAQR